VTGSCEYSDELSGSGATELVMISMKPSAAEIVEGHIIGRLMNNKLEGM
jgi:hypothetical protein